MGPEETGRVTALLRELAADHTIVLIEHDMDAIFAAADTLTVLVEGSCSRTVRRRKFDNRSGARSLSW